MLIDISVREEGEGNKEFLQAVRLKHEIEKQHKKGRPAKCVFFSFSDISVVLDPLVCVCILHVNLQEVVFM